MAGPERAEVVLARRAVLDHLAFLLSSAELCLYEPHYYGTLRLLDGASRFVGTVLDADDSDPSLVALSRQMEDAKALRKTDPAAYRRLLRELPAAVAEAIRALPVEFDR
jgi:Family of unknown function (DUF6092)